MTADTKSLTQTEEFFREYTSDEAIQKYSRPTAGHGINYLLDHDYKTVYLRAFDLLPASDRQDGIRVLEFGCGAGMNLLHLIPILRGQGIKVSTAIGTDFSPVLIDAAKAEAKPRFGNDNQTKVQFCVAKNETLLSDLSSALGRQPDEIANSFHFIFGVNTVRYCHAGKTEMDNARDIFDLLVPGGVCVIIDMNNRFPLFRSDLRNSLRWNKVEQCYVPSLEEYAAPFAETGFELLRQEHFCWIPHSASGLRFGVMRALSPILNVVAKSRAMRSLVVARKPMTRQ